VSLGEEKPVCTDHTEDCWWKNAAAISALAEFKRDWVGRY
jgi:hypothetical protein